MFLPGDGELRKGKGRTLGDAGAADREVEAPERRARVTAYGLPEERAGTGIPALDHVVLIALTGYGSHAAGSDHHLVKPVDVDALRDVVGSVAAA